MFRNPRENENLPDNFRILPSTGRPPSPQRFPPRRPNPRVPAPMPAARAKTQTKLKTTKASPAKGTLVKPKGPLNGNILTFFKKAEELADNLFVKERYNELGGPDKRRRTEAISDDVEEGDAPVADNAISPAAGTPTVDVKSEADGTAGTLISPRTNENVTKRRGPFMYESDSEYEESGDDIQPTKADSFDVLRHGILDHETPVLVETNAQTIAYETRYNDDLYAASEESVQKAYVAPPHFRREETSYTGLGDIEGFEDIDDFDDDEFPDDGEETVERRYMAEQIKLQMSDGVYEGELDDESLVKTLDQAGPCGEEDALPKGDDVAACPICNVEFNGLTDGQASEHVNNCLDGNPTPLPVAQAIDIKSEPSSPQMAPRRPLLKLARPPKPGQANPIMLESKAKGPSSAFAKLMSGHAEDIAWKSAAESEKVSRGKPAFERTCPFYKIMPDMSICVDAFRYGAVEGCNGYFLSHFHSDHYIGLTASWRHGPIYCSKVTGNLVRQQLRVDPKYVVDLEFEVEREIPNTPGVRVTMIPANHCPGSSLFLFEKPLAKSPNAKKKRILHCGDFRACQAHLEHPLLRPDVRDHISGKQKEQKIDVCYLDTTYLNPRYAFPPQESVIKACADMCVSLSKASIDDTDDWETMKKQRAGAGMVQFLDKGVETKIKQEDVEPTSDNGNKKRGKLLVVVGTYSIGKERICMGIARALDCKIFAAPGKMRICAALEDPELMSRLTSDPRKAQIHMTPLFEIRADTLDEYLKDYRDTFTRAVAFRPSGWNYKPPNSRFTESPSVQTVLHSNNWKSIYSMRELKPQPGSTKRATCYGVPYSEHSSFRELSMFCVGLRIEKIVPTVNVGSAKGRERMKLWIERWMVERKKNGLFKAEDFDR